MQVLGWELIGCEGCRHPLGAHRQAARVAPGEEPILIYECRYCDCVLGVMPC